MAFPRSAGRLPGARPGLSFDSEISYGTGMFTEVRVAFNIQRALAPQSQISRESIGGEHLGAC